MTLCSGVASSASGEESEEMYSGTSSVPMISSGSKSRLKEAEENMKRKIKQKDKEQIKKELTSEAYASLTSRSPEVVYPCPWRWGFFF
jgi:hypothetical protein